MKLFIDTETTGFPRSAPDGDPMQPHLVSLAALLTDDAGVPKGFVGSIIKPEGWTIPAETSAIHGITDEIAARTGNPLVGVMRQFAALLVQATQIVAYNLKFDAAILRSALVRAKLPAALLTKPVQTCAMLQAAEVIKLPSKKGSGFKNPNLGEAYKHFYGQDLAHAHSATGDMLACAAVHFATLGTPLMVTLPTPSAAKPPSPSAAVVTVVSVEKPLSEDEVALAIRTSPALWLETCGKIEDKEKNLVRPVVNVFQRRMSDVYEHCIATGRPHRQVDLKPRRVGGTTMGAAITYHHMRNYPSNGIMIADTFTKSDKLFATYVRFAANDSFDWKQAIQGGVKTLQMGESVLSKLSAEAPKGARGDTLQAIHASEVAFWPSAGTKSADKTNASLRIALAPHPKTSDVEETTPYGASGVFYNIWQHARWPEFCDYWKRWGGQPDKREFPDNGYLRVFAAWYEMPEYAHPLLSQREFDDLVSTLTPREKRGIKLYQWTPQQIKWRRWAIRTLCLGNEGQFDEEFPEDPVSCFRTSGSPRFDTDGMTVLEARCKTVAVEYGDLILTDPDDADCRVGFKRSSENEASFIVWEHPRVGCRYILSADPRRGSTAEGSEDDTASDCHSVGVWRADYLDADNRRWPPRLVARVKPPWRGDNKPTAKLVKLLSRYYGGCICVIESNQLGLIDACKDLEVNLYVEERFDMISQKTTRHVGWSTTEKTRDLPIDALGDATREKLVDIGCLHIVDEMRTFVRNRRGKCEAASGRHDDDVIMAGLALYCMAHATLLKEKPRTRKRPADEDNWVRL